MKRFVQTCIFVMLTALACSAVSKAPPICASSASGEACNLTIFPNHVPGATTLLAEAPGKLACGIINTDLNKGTLPFRICGCKSGTESSRASGLKTNLSPQQLSADRISYYIFRLRKIVI
ncbi:MAG: hypothetical protein AB7D05_04400 [Mangrovibacterium sp.]